MSTSLPGMTLPRSGAGNAGVQFAAVAEFAGLVAVAAKVWPGRVPAAS
jgi:hypothetical protein